jgi:hypothetical protein
VLDAGFFGLAAFGKNYRNAGIVLYRQKKLQDLIKLKDMKKTMIAFAFMMLGLIGSIYAAAPKPNIPVRVESQFSQQFAHATAVRWEEGKNFFKATFEAWGRTLFAFYTDNGDLMGVASNLSSPTLPERLQLQIKHSYSGFWITDLFGYHNQDERGFVVTLENADKVVVLKAVGDGGWNVYKTTVKS